MDIVDKKLKLKPNLENYDIFVNFFNWSEHFKDLSFFSDGKFNAGFNIIDWNLDTKKDKTAIIWEGENGNSAKLTFGNLSQLSNKFANILNSFGVQKGDRVFTFLPRIPEIYYIFLAILKTGAIAGNFFASFGKEALLDRLKNSQAKILITNKELGKRVEEIKKQLPDLEKIIYVDEGFSKLMKDASPEFGPVHLELNSPMFMLFTSATGNTPISGIVIPQKALLQEYLTASWVLDLKDSDIYWCTADPGWVTGTVYGIMMPLLLGITQIVYEGRFSAESWYGLIQKHKVSVWYTAPTALRLLATEEEKAKLYDLSSLRHLVSVGEALSPESIYWSQKIFGLPIHDTYWQTETGAMMIANFPCLPIKPGSMGKPVPGIEAAVVDENGNTVPDNTEGNIVFKKDFPGQLVEVWQNPQSLKRYFVPPDSSDTDSTSNWYYTGDRGKRDKDGYFWFIGRANEVIKTSGERVGPFEVESAINKFPGVLECAVIGKPDEIRGAIIKAFIVLKSGVSSSDSLKEEIQKFVKTELAGHAYPREIEFIEKLPKNRSGKIVRRILKAQELGESLGDTSTII